MEVASTLLVGGAVLIMAAVALVTIWQLLHGLPEGHTRTDWYVLFVFILLFIFGYIAYLIDAGGNGGETRELIAPAMFFTGAAFVALMARAMLRTVQDVRRLGLLEAENITDTLTGLRNRRDFDRRWSAEQSRARRFALPLSLLMIDLDHFKRINDGYGHAAGDRVLAVAGHLIRSCLRESDVAARYGGEEFAVIASHTQPQAATTLAERIRALIERDARHTIEQLGSERAITVSIGIAGCDNAAAGSEGLFERADQALYAAKQGGRNRVVVAGEAERQRN
jgi:diguanylate cyclase (GGDEF)-like protein